MGRRDLLDQLDEVLPHANPPVFVPGGDTVWGPYDDAWDRMIAGEKTTQQALTEGVPAIQENLDKAWRAWESGS